jgi:hypothetical protein
MEADDDQYRNFPNIRRKRAIAFTAFVSSQEALPTEPS